MKALSKQRAEPGLWLIDAPVPSIQSNEVLIRVHTTAICGTDIHIYHWDQWSQKMVPIPTITGHEFVGTIAEIGSQVPHFKIGMRVSSEGRVVCGHCIQCRNHLQNLCVNMKGIGVKRNGAFAEYVAVPATNVIPIPDDVPNEVAAIFDPLGNAVYSTLMFDCVAEDVLITGAGPIGVMAAMVARHVGARKIVITDISPYRLDLAKKLGFDAVHADELDPNYQCQVGIEMSGHPSALNTLIRQTQSGGNIALLGILPEASVDFSQIVFRGLTLKGISGRDMFSTWHKMIRMVQSGLPVQELITHEFSAENYQEAFDVASAGKSGKVLLRW